MTVELHGEMEMRALRQSTNKPTNRRTGRKLKRTVQSLLAQPRSDAERELADRLLQERIDALRFRVGYPERDANVV